MERKVVDRADVLVWKLKKGRVCTLVEIPRPRCFLFVFFNLEKVPTKKTT